MTTRPAQSEGLGARIGPSEAGCPGSSASRAVAFRQEVRHRSGEKIDLLVLTCARLRDLFGDGQTKDFIWDQKRSKGMRTFRTTQIGLLFSKGLQSSQV